MPALPDESYDTKQVTFSPSANIDAIMQHLKVRLWDGGGADIVDAILSSIGSGQIAIKLRAGDEAEWILRSDGSDVNYTLTDASSSHGHYVYSMEWV